MFKKYFSTLSLLLIGVIASAQTDIDGLMMGKKNLCVGPVFGFSSWKNYWEGTLKRDNANMGTVSTTSYSIMANYGITERLNVLVGLPYIKTKASEGQLTGLKGFQDFSVWVKYEAWSREIGKKAVLSAYAVGGVSVPGSNYVVDFLPMSIGLGTKNLSLRALLDLEYGKLFATGSATYILRSNTKLDRTAYYTTEMHYTNEVKMPDAASCNFRIGYRHNENIAELVFDNFTTLGGFDISRNNMPFPGNRMNASRLGAGFKYNTSFVNGLSVVGSAYTTIAGRNMGQAKSFNAGIFYIMDFTSKKAHEHKM
ncbi:MAG: hypothetical protein WAT19_02955 [Ferruginibacter sp.]